MLNHVVAAVTASRGGRALMGRADVVNGPHYRRGDEPRREPSAVRTRAIVAFCRAADDDAGGKPDLWASIDPAYLRFLRREFAV
jgi:hypothetical protein